MAESNQVHIEYVPLGELRRWPRNPKDHSLGDIHESYDRFGYVAPMLLDERTGRLVAGHGRLDALQQRKASGKPAPERIVTRDGQWLVPVVRGVSFESDEEAEAYGIADNRLVEAGGWNDAALAQVLADLAAGPGLNGIGFDGDDLDALLASLGQLEAVADPGAQLSKADELQERWQVQTGDVWQCGSHRICCGDCTDAAVVEKVMGEGERATAVVSDPPWGIGLDTDYTRFTTGFDVKRTTHAPIAGDDKPFDPRPFLGYDAVVLWGANFYAQYLPIGSWLVWDKRFKNDTAFLSDAELAWMKSGHGIYIFSLTSQGCVRPEKVQHPTQKPVELIEWCIEKCKAGPVVYDPCLGSGTTLVACQRLGRRGRGIEIHAPYVSVCLERLSQMQLDCRKVAGV